MMRYYLVSENWLISPTARRVYRACAWISFLLLPTFYLLRYFLENTKLPEPANLAMHLLLLIAATATAVIIVAMQFFLFVEDESPAWKQILWVIAIQVWGIGAGLYVLLSYSKSPCFDKPAPEAS